MATDSMNDNDLPHNDNKIGAGRNDDKDHHDDAGWIMTAPSLYQRNAFYRQTRKRGKVFKTVQECYVRDDLGFGTHFVDADQNPSKRRVKDAVVGKPRDIATVEQLLDLLHPSAPLVICDTNVLLHNLDVLEQSAAAVPNIVIPQTALVECRANQLTAYDRTVELLRAVGDKRLVIFFADQHHAETAGGDTDRNGKRYESINDANDARLRRVARFYGSQLRGSNVRVILWTDDAANRRIAADEDKGLYEAKSVREYIVELEEKDSSLALSDLVAQFSSHETEATGSGRKTKDGKNTGTLQRMAKKECFPAHLDASSLSRGVQSGRLFRGVLRSTDKDNSMVTIRRGEERVAITIQGFTSRNRGVDGDIVAIALNPIKEWISAETGVSVASDSSKGPTPSSGANDKDQVGIASETAEPTHGEIDNVQDTIALDDLQRLRPTGKVVGIIRRNFSNYCGSIYSKQSKAKGTKPQNKNQHKESMSSLSSLGRDEIAAKYEVEHADGSTTCVFFAVDTKIPPVLIRTSQRDRLVGQRILVAIDSWPSTSPYPLGHYVKSMGEAGSKDVETAVLLHQHKIPHEPFPAKVLACLPPSDYKISIDNSPGRTDLRGLPVLSIDPPGCKDIDDALHCIVLPNGNYQAGVHIADVTHYVKAGTAIDLEAANRSTSTYLVNKRLDMLPALLTTDLCSLKGNVDRYAFSVLWEVTPDAEIVNVEFKKSIIHSIAALTYQQAQSFIDQPGDMNTNSTDKTEIQAGAVKRLASLARKFRKRRIDAGALTLASPEVKFVLDTESNPTDVQSYTLFEANALVEEFMLLANITVAKKILRKFPTLSVLRRHPAPNRAMFESLISKAKCRGFEIDIEDSKRLADSLDAAVIESDPYFNKLLRILSTRCMSPAQYFCSGEYKPTEWHHYGLAAPVYTHFTSPIRRCVESCKSRS